jgi:hypothetical protein
MAINELTVEEIQEVSGADYVRGYDFIWDRLPPSKLIPNPRYYTYLYS